MGLELVKTKNKKQATAKGIRAFEKQVRHETRPIAEKELNDEEGLGQSGKRDFGSKGTSALGNRNKAAPKGTKEFGQRELFERD